MSLYELSSEVAAVREGERVVSLEGRSFPTLVMRWDSRLFDQPWITTIVLDYTIALPPLIVGQARFNEVRLAAYVGGTPPKFMYFGTELTSNVPRLAPEMENSIGPAKLYQEFRLEETTCPVPYLKLIQTTPRVYGNGPQDYYSPPIKVERFDGVAGPQHVADLFPTVVADLESVSGAWLQDPQRGFWRGSRFIGPSAIAIKRDGKVVGLHRRAGRGDKDALPSTVVLRDPALDLRAAWVAIDLGASTTTVAIRSDRGPTELLRIGSTAPAMCSADFESPSEIAFEHLGRVVKAWRDRVVLPLTAWDDVKVGHAARALRLAPGGDRVRRAAAGLVELSLLREPIEEKRPVVLRGAADPDYQETLKKPAPPVVDEDGIGAHEPFDPIELYAYYVGLHVNQRSRGLFTRYALTLPQGWPSARRQGVLVAFRRGLYRSLPAGLVPFDDVHRLEVIDAGPPVLSFAVHAFRAFGIQPKGDVVTFFAIDAGASETGLVGGVLRDAGDAERRDGYERVLEHLPASSIPWLGGERLLHRLAYRTYLANEEALRELRVPIDVPAGEAPYAAAAELGAAHVEARANTTLLKDALRPALEGPEGAKLPSAVRLLTAEGRALDVALLVDASALCELVDTSIADALVAIRGAAAEVAAKVGRGAEPHEGLHVFLGGRLGTHDRLARALAEGLPAGVRFHRFLEPAPGNLAAGTPKTSVALGQLAARFEKLLVVPRHEARDAFRFRVGKARHGELAAVLDPSVDYDTWREMGACTRPDVEVLFVSASDEDALAADDPRVLRAVCSLGDAAVGQRVYLRAVGSARVEVSVGPPGGEPGRDAARWSIDLSTSLASPAA
jgi:hypothetical protein